MAVPGASVELAPFITFQDLKKQLLTRPESTMIRYKGNHWTLQSFREHCNRVSKQWQYETDDIALFDPVSLTVYELTPSTEPPVNL